mmetsp:Transcript_33861/g.71031  ORF Transcript_33861/g.71031 Transcript_33861/m.71031 type:complete len:198 (-) Transcript_33861:1976-2569(-)
MATFGIVAAVDLAKASPTDDIRPTEDFMHTQRYISMSKSRTGYQRRHFFCPYKNRCGCQISFSVKEYPDRFELLHSGIHNRNEATKGNLSPKQRAAVIADVKASPVAAAAAVQLNLRMFSLGKRVASDLRSSAAVNRLVKKTLRKIMEERVPGIEIDGSEALGSMTLLAEWHSLQRFIGRHNDPADPYHMDEHEPIC